MQERLAHEKELKKSLQKDWNKKEMLNNCAQKKQNQLETQKGILKKKYLCIILPQAGPSLGHYALYFKFSN